MSIVLGIHFGHDAAASVVIDGKVISNISSERMYQSKKTDFLSVQLLQKSLDEAGISINDVDAVVATNYMPSNENDHNSPLVIYNFDQVVSRIHGLSSINSPFSVFSGRVLDRKMPIYLLDHHMAHAASTYYLSNFDKSLVLTLDACSPNTPELNGVVCIGDRNKLEAIYYPGNMVAQGYNLFTANLQLGLPLFKAGSTMGLASYGTPHQEVIDNIDRYIDICFSEGDAQNAFAEVWYQLSDGLPQVFKYDINNPAVFENFNGKTKLYETKAGRDLAASIQYIFEKSVLKSVTELANKYPNSNLCLAGGSFLSCNTNSLIKETNFFNDIFVVPAAGDDGLAVGSALYVEHNIYGNPRKSHSVAEISYLGEKPNNNIPVDYETISRMIADGKIIAWYYGGSEFGPRALGHRSIIADPRNFHNREVINFMVKNREWFRPLAPSVLEEEAANWFYPGDPSPYMLFTQKVLKPELVPAVVHIDGTARIQTVNENDHGPYYRLIKEFYKLTGIPMVLNTSLNGNGKPVVETETDAMQMFHNSPEIDVLVVNGNIYTK